MSDVNGTTCTKSERYRGFIIDSNINKSFQTPYCTIYNPKNHMHVHINSYNAAKNIVDCYHAITKTKYGRLIRNRAMSLDGNKVCF